MTSRNQKAMKFTIVCLIAFCTLSIAGQQKTGLIMWGVEPGCKSYTTKSISTPPRCDFIVLEGSGYRIVEHDGRTIAVTFATDGDYLLADVLVQNGSKDRFTILPTRWAVFGYADEAASSTGKPLLQSYAESCSKVADRAERKGRWRNFFIGLGAALATNTTEVQGRVYDSYGLIANYSGTMTSPDTSAQQRAANDIQRNRAEASDKADAIMEIALQANTIMPDAKVAGRVYFKKGKAKFYEVYLPIGEILYLFTVKRR
jgi:hypothetical protein